MSHRPISTASGEALARGETIAARADSAAIKRALLASGGNVTAAAAALGVPYRTLQRRITDLGVRVWLEWKYPSGRRPR